MRLATTIEAILLAVAIPAAAGATTVQWADLTNYDSATGTVTGTIDVNGTSVGVTFSSPTPGSYQFVQTGAPSDTNYWTEPDPARRPYTGGSVSNAPPTTDLIALNQGSLKTITFSQPVSDVYLGLVSWNGNAGTFDQPFSVVSDGCGYWGCGTFGNVTPVSFTGNGELHGVIGFTGTFSTTSFTDVSESWHGIQIGIGGLAPPPGAPGPELGVGLLPALAGAGALGLTRSRRRKARATA